MSMPLKIIEATKEGFEPFKIVSLWDMHEFHARKFLEVCNGLAAFSHHIDAVDARESTKDPPSCEEMKTIILLGISKYGRKSILELRETLSDLGLLCSVSAADELLRPINMKLLDYEWNNVKFNVNCLRSTIRSELGDRSAMMIPADRAGYYKHPEMVLGKRVIEELSELLDEATEAGNSFALGIYTASVFHLMRIMEYVVHNFAKRVGITTDLQSETFGRVLNNHILPVIDKWGKGREKDKYRACYKSMDGLRPRRDQIIHHGDHYSAERAVMVMGAVRSCIEQYLDLPDPPEEEEKS